MVRVVHMIRWSFQTALYGGEKKRKQEKGNRKKEKGKSRLHVVHLVCELLLVKKSTSPGALHSVPLKRPSGTDRL